MKKLLILSAVAMLTATAAGCQCGPFGLFNRREALAAPVITSCEPACNPCGEGPALGGTYLAPPTIVPGPIVQ